MEQVVWEQVRALLEEPRRVADEYRRRIAQARDGAATPDEIVRLDRQMTSLRRGIGRLIDSYAEGIIDKTEFEPRIAGLKQRVSKLQMRHQAALEADESERDLALVISRLEDFSAKVTTGLDNLDRTDMRDIIRTVVRRVEIDASRIEMIFRVPSPDGPPGPRSTNQNDRFLATLYRRWSRGHSHGLAATVRLARDFERYARSTVAAFIRLAMIRIMLRRLAAGQLLS